MRDRRLIKELLKWTSPVDLLKTTAVVSRLWNEASESDAVWETICSDYRISTHRAEGQLLKAVFRSQVKPNCSVLSDSRCEFHDCETRKLVREIRFQREVQCDYRAAAVVLPWGGLVICGGTRSRAAIHISDFGEVRSLQSMSEARFFHSAVFLYETLYVFGGYEARPGSAEKLTLYPFPSLPDTKWQPLPRSSLQYVCCSPCAYKESIYLCGGSKTKSEVFNTDTEKYSLLPFELPESDSSCVCFMRGGELVVFTEHFVTYWKQGREVTSIENLQGNFFLWASFKPVLISKKLYCFDNGTIAVFDMEEKRLVSN